jgi:DNA-directed RNA polymerase subunit M/transcription elongation factor TFIIS
MNNNSVFNNSTSNDAILRPYCSTCNSLMHSIEINGEVLFKCDYCDHSENPIFIDTVRNEINENGAKKIEPNYQFFIADVDELVETKKIIEENKSENVI